MTRPGDRTPPSRQEGPRVNEEITSSKIRLVDEKGEMIGVVTLQEGLEQARQLNLDLVEISPQVDPPVCKILNYGKHRYDQQKKKAEAKKKQKIVDVKEIQMRPNIDQNDFDVKCRAIKRFLESGDKVKLIIRFRGREMSHQSIGMSVLARVKELFELSCKIESPPMTEGKSIIMVLAPK